MTHKNIHDHSYSAWCLNRALTNEFEGSNVPVTVGDVRRRRRRIARAWARHPVGSAARKSYHIYVGQTPELIGVYHD